MKRVLFFGIFDPAYARNRVLRLGFERNGWEVLECRVDPRGSRGAKKYIQLFLKGLRASFTKPDIVLVCFPGQSVVWIARLLFGKRVIFDAFLSLFDANVHDRKLYSAQSFRGRRDFLLDTWSCRIAHKVLLDTNQHIEYFVKTFGIARDTCVRVWISADDTVFVPNHSAEPNAFTVHFHGNFIPLQGILYIVEAARLLRNAGVRFRIVGGGQDAARVQEAIAANDLTTVIERIDKVPVTQIPNYIAQSHVVLGIFGDTEKTQRVVPNKVYEAMAMGKAIVTSDTPAVRELAGMSEALVLVPTANPEALATAILTLKDDRDLRERLGHDARAIFDRELMPEHLVAELLRTLRLTT